MQLLKEIRDEKFPDNNYDIKIREASRIVAIDDSGLLPLLFVSKQSYHKLPGGGIENSEDRISALLREVMEETGCQVKVKGEIGKIVEYRSATSFSWQWNLKQTSYCYWGEVTAKDNNLAFTEEELSEGYQLVWLPLEKAIVVLESDKPKNFEGSFIKERDLTFLRKFEEMMQNM